MTNRCNRLDLCFNTKNIFWLIKTIMTRRQFIQSVGALFAGYGFSDYARGKAAPEELSVKPRHVICVLGEWKSLQIVEKTVSEFGRGFSLDKEYSKTEPDQRMEKAFSACLDRVYKTFTNNDWAKVKRHNTVAYVLSPPIDRNQALAISAAALEITARLVGAGATAVKSESAGIAHGLDHWMSLAQKKALRLAWVRRPIQDEDTLYSCGMHLLGQPDIECVGGFEELEAVRWIDALAEKLISGQRTTNRFSLDGRIPEKKLQSVPCERYEEDEFFFNPYGYVRITV